ncbi:cupin domain-containing protein [Nannocystis sp.]|uniref:1,2-dihydroxy-3-keto-5-methylthiopentene dioxygenase n=1 Tax=Nannocystis sp. TaxID=1962667 RepID=UPI002429025E|nr:cupin domain-containing protein [Nannocystis sp.]MBK7825494.1 cupin domain-containing protein [Nannocystis sp.]MBK9756787.1 cupin domain-containing protein [Nannocystis sp.]
MRLSWLESDAAIDAGELARVGVVYERLALDDYQGALERLKVERGYVTQDIVELHPELPNLRVVCDKFKDEHLHRDDEVRFVLAGAGIFDIRAQDGRWMRVEVEAGDLIVVPADLYHRFFLTERQQIRCVRLFKDAAGWVPEYRV